MTDLKEKFPTKAVALSFGAGALLVAGLWGIATAASNNSGIPEAGPTAKPAPSAGAIEPSASPADPGPTGAPPADVAECNGETTTVSSADDLQAALSGAQAGDVIAIAPGTYEGNFVATVSGTENEPITLCGTKDSVLTAGGIKNDYVFHLDGAKYWHLVGFSVTNGQKGVMADTTVGSIIEGLTVTTTGDEAIHLRNFSTDNIVRGNTISDTGHRKPKFGEGIYIGTAESNWCENSGCKPDKSDRNQILDNVIFDTSSEAIDIKEGTSDGIVRGNSFDGSEMTGGFADSWVDVKGNNWIIEDNTGKNSPQDGFQTHEIVDGMGTGNVFRNNTAVVNGPGFGYSLTPERANVVECSNKATAAEEGLSNVSCQK